MDLLQVVISGLLLGGVYALFAAGMNMIFGVLRVINLAHGELMMLGAYTTFWLFAMANVNPLLNPRLCPRGVLAGRGDRADDDRAGRRPAVTLVAAADVRPVDPLHGNRALAVDGELSLGAVFDRIGQRAWHRPLANPARGLCHRARADSSDLRFLRFTTFGKAIRATAQNAEVAQVCGINVGRVRLVTFALGSAMAAVAGSLIAMIFTVSPEMGRIFIGRAFAIVVLGGLGSFVGAFIGALVLGVVETVTAYFTDTQIAEGVSYAVLVLVLLLRPSGLFGEKE